MPGLACQTLHLNACGSVRLQYNKTSKHRHIAINGFWTKNNRAENTALILTLMSKKNVIDYDLVFVISTLRVVG